MIIDSSAVVAILDNEPLGEACLRALRTAQVHRISAATFLEVSIVVDNSPNLNAGARFDELMLEHRVIIEPVTESQARLARLAHR